MGTTSSSSPYVLTIENPQERFKLRNVVIAAPDINIEVYLQRTEREGTRWAAERWTTYTSARDTWFTHLSIGENPDALERV